MAEQQVIPARHGTATFVPAGQTIKIINTSGSQVVDTWAFALPTPPGPKGQQSAEEEKPQEKKNETKQETPQKEPPQQKKTPAKKGGDLPSQEEAEKATQEGLAAGEQQAQNGAQQQKNTWSSYVPSIGWSSGKKDGAKGAGGETEQQKNSKTWSSYFPSGKGFSNYVPKSASDTVSSFAHTVGVRSYNKRSLRHTLICSIALTRPQQVLPRAAAGLFQNARRRSRLER